MYSSLLSTGTEMMKDRIFARVRDLLREVTDRGEDASRRLVRQMLALEWLMGQPLVGPQVRAAMNTPELRPILALADVIGCIELRLRGIEGAYGSIHFHMITSNLTSERAASLLGQTTDYLASVVDGIEEVLGNFAEPGYDARGRLSTISGGLSVILSAFVREAQALLGPDSPCLTRALTGLAGYGGATAKPPREVVLWQGRERVVRANPEGRRYITYQKAPVYLDTIRGKYRYKKN